MLPPLKAAELSDGTLRYVLLVAALLTPRPPGLLVLNEPETSLHPDLLPALARLASVPPGVRRCSSCRTPPASSTRCSGSPSARRSSSTRRSVKLASNADELSKPPWEWPARWRQLFPTESALAPARLHVLQNDNDFSGTDEAMLFPGYALERGGIFSQATGELEEPGILLPDVVHGSRELEPLPPDAQGIHEALFANQRIDNQHDGHEYQKIVNG